MNTKKINTEKKNYQTKKYPGKDFDDLRIIEAFPFYLAS